MLFERNFLSIHFDWGSSFVRLDNGTTETTININTGYPCLNAMADLLEQATILPFSVFKGGCKWKGFLFR